MSRRLFWLIIVMLALGLVVLSSASTAVSLERGGSSTHYLKHQVLVGVLPGIAAMLLLWRMDYRRLRIWALPLLFLSLVLMGLVFVPSLGLTLHGATGWLTVLGYSFQPAEFLKLALVLYLAAWLADRTDILADWKHGILPLGLIVGSSAVLLILQKDLGTLGVLLMLAGAIYFIAGAPLKHVGAGILAMVLIVGILAAVSPERMSRITTLFNPSADARGAGWQLNQAFIAIGSGGIWGAGQAQGTAKFGFLPEPMNDSVFAVLVEEHGLAGGITLLALLATLILMLAAVARRAPDRFGALLASGMLAWVAVQSLVNLMAITGIGPLTGIPLPFVSYGGTAMLMLLAGLGIVLNVAEHERTER